MKTLLGFIFCFLWIFAPAGNHRNSFRTDDLKVGLSKSSIASVANLPEILLPELLIQYAISGTVRHAGTNEPFADVSLTFSGLGTIVTNSLGQYSILVDAGWTGTVTPYYCGFYIFSPTSKSYTNVSKNSIQDYTGTSSKTFTIQGTFTNYITSLPFKNTTIDFGNGYTTATNSQGQYFLEVQACESFVLTPTSADYDFVPISRSYSNVTADLFNQDFGVTPKIVGQPTGWEFVNTGNISLISVKVTANPNFCGVPLQAGDWIGVFYVGSDNNLHCGGAGQWTGTQNTFIAAQGDDTYTTAKDGFVYGETMNWKVYSSTQTQQEYKAYPVIQAGGSLKWYPLGTTIVTSLPANKTHYVVIPQGWSGISSYILPRTGTSAVATLMAPILSKLIILQNLSKTYWPSQSINTIGNWSSTSGYKIKVTEPVTLPIEGCDYSPKTINLVNGWNLIPVLSDCNVLIEPLFGANLSKVTVIKEVAGTNIYWPAMNIKTLLTLQAGKAYLMAVTQNFPVTFPACMAFKDEDVFEPVLENNSPWNNPVMTPSNHAIALSAAVLGKLMAGDVIGAFTQDGICAGLVQVDDLSQNILLQVFGDDPTTTEKEGYSDNEVLKFKLYRPQLSQEFEIGFDFDATLPSSNGLFATDGLSAVNKIVFNPTFIGENTNNSLSFYPNPGNGLVEFVAGDSQRNFTITILDLKGQKIFQTTFSGKTQINLTNSPKGIYIVKIENNNCVKVEKLVIQ